jgi:hypothetical protein
MQWAEPALHRATAFGLRWESELALTSFTAAAECDGPAEVVVRVVHALADRGEVAWTGKAALYFADGVRFGTGGGTLFDVIAPGCIDVCPGADWQGGLPAHFYSTVAALLLALRGYLPIHGSALEIDGRAVLLCGQAGAGKSTLAANLVALGARLISDDLSVLVAGETPKLLAGRPSIRLHADTAAWLASRGKVQDVMPSYDHKIVVRPARVPAHSEYPLQRIILLDRQDTELPPALGALAFCAQMFRPKMMRRLAGSKMRLAALAATASKIGVSRVLALHRYDADIAMQRALRIMNMTAAT